MRNFAKIFIILLIPQIALSSFKMEAKVNHLNVIVHLVLQNNHEEYKSRAINLANAIIAYKDIDINGKGTLIINETDDYHAGFPMPLGVIFPSDKVVQMGSINIRGNDNRLTNCTFFHTTPMHHLEYRVTK